VAEVAWAASLSSIYRELSERVDSLSFGEPVTHVYNPLAYAWAPHRRYLERFGGATGRVVFLGMNPGPWGMAQTGVPFGDVGFVKDWMGIEAPVDRPEPEHPKRPIDGFACSRSEVSGSRLWGWARDRFGPAGSFFERFFVLNYCPLVFMEASSRNRTPDHLPREEQVPLFAACDLALGRALQVLEPRLVVGVGLFAQSRAAAVTGNEPPPVARILHPSPASPAANRDWAGTIERQLREAGVEV
jgi:single-strand selective monofunctional uracil DNA glycosylase